MTVEDIVETLRYHASLSEMDYGFCAKAAEELEKCRDANKCLRDEIERLREIIIALRDDPRNINEEYMIARLNSLGWTVSRPTGAGAGQGKWLCRIFGPR